ncbi:MAG TPA: subclass B3 metallo-beta-lactamase [Vicinamibacterales bacterium]
MTSWLTSLALLLSLFQASTFKADPPHQCEDCPTWNKPRAPFRVYGNTYYVGTDGLSALLITGDAGHVLLDAGLPQSAAVIDTNIRTLGFKTEDVKLILISHGHFDHAGGANALQRHTGATVAASASTADALRRGENTPDDPQYAFGKAFNGFPAVKNVKVVGDQEVLTVGKTAITVHLIPGHSPGSTAYTWQSCENGKCLNMVYADSLTSPSAPGFKYGSRLDSFQKSIEKVAALPCDIVLSPHPQFTQVDQKLKRRAEMKGSGADPFIDPGGCKAYAAGGMKQLEARRAEEAKK